MSFKQSAHVGLLDLKNFTKTGKLYKLSTDKHNIDIGYTIVLFMTVWCKYCIELKPTFMKAAKAACCSVNVYAVDCSDDKGIKNKINSLYKLTHDTDIISGYPTILRYFDGKLVDKFNGNRDVETLKNYMIGADDIIKSNVIKNHTLNMSSELSKLVDKMKTLNTSSKLSKLVEKMKNNEYTTIMFHVNWCGYCVRTLPEFIKAKNMLGEQNYALEIESEASKELVTAMKNKWNLKIDGFPTIIRFKKDKIDRVYNGNRLYLDLLKFMTGM